MKKEMTNTISRKDFLKGTAAGALTLAATSMMGGLAFAEEAPAEEAAPEAVLTAEPVVEIKSGAIRGYMDDNTYAFLGVPYATAERFAFPQEVEPWEGVRNTQAYGFVCPIPAATSVGADEMVWPHRYWIEGEQCMNLNIWTQSIDPSAKKPVYVYIHGGGFNNGSSIEGAAQEGKNLSAYADIVVVTINHRLNVLGYVDLSAYGDEYSQTVHVGNADMLAALKWVHENIEAFGGDPENVTIGGQSGGGRKVMTLMRMPEAEGLFGKAIIESTSLYQADKETTACIAEHLLDNLGLDGTQIEELKAVPIRELEIAAEKAVAQAREDGHAGATWAPLLDDIYVKKEICDWAKSIPVIIGATFSEQGSTFRKGDGRKNEWTEEEITANLAEAFGDSADAIREEFANVFPDKKVQDVYFYDGSSYRTSLYTVCEELNGHQDAPVYTYLFSYESPVNGGTTAYHCSELIYAFHNVEIPVVNRAVGGKGNTYAPVLQDKVATAWTNFMKTGNPSQEGLEWLPYTQEEQYLMRFDNECTCEIRKDAALNELIVNANK